MPGRVRELRWPGQTLTLKSVHAKEGSSITMLGFKEPLMWIQDAAGLAIRLPAALQEEAQRPMGIAYAFKIEEEP